MKNSIKKVLEPSKFDKNKKKDQYFDKYIFKLIVFVNFLDFWDFLDFWQFFDIKQYFD